HVIVDGRVVVRDGNLATADGAAVREALREQVQRRSREVASPPQGTGEAMERIETFIRSLGDSAATVSNQNRRS
nr:hypothetical protein [Solirubrobacterales bacterium]